jgi:hypothetical protein
MLHCFPSTHFLYILPPTDSRVCLISIAFHTLKSLLTNALATGPSSISSSSSVNGNLGMTQTRIGTSAMIITGNPIAAIVYKHQLQLVNLSCTDDD